MLTYARRRTCEAIADDMAAETFAVAWRRADAIPADPLPWLIGVARRVLATQRRSGARQHRLAQRLRAVPVEHEVPTVEGRVGDALTRLSETDREAISPEVNPAESVVPFEDKTPPKNPGSKGPVVIAIIAVLIS